MSFLKRNLKIRNSTFKEHIKQGRPIIEYAYTTWNPYLKNDIHRIEMVQRRASIYVETDITTPYLLQTCQKN